MPAKDQGGPKERGSDQAFFAIKFDLIGPKTELDFALYRHSQEAGRVLLLQPGRSLGQEVWQRLSRAGLDLYIRRSDKPRYLALQEKVLARLVEEGEVDDRRLAEVAYDLALNVVESSFDLPEPEALRRAENSLRTVVDLIITREKFVAGLLRQVRNSPLLHVHCCNVAVFGLGLAKVLLDLGEECHPRSLAPALFFHDLGHTVTAQGIFDKPRNLTPLEWARIRSHMGIGLEMLTEAGLADETVNHVLLQHHERLDGSGFPDHLRGGEIHLGARICAIADVYDAFTSDRGDQERLSPLAAARTMIQEMAPQFDQGLMGAFLDMFKTVS
jgi:HD-GYP domain-containing protein (c-di-GMP phosphodiesterase class II)